MFEKYVYQAFELNGQQYWSPYGITGSYGNIKKVVNQLKKHVQKNHPNCILFAEKLDLDHIQKTPAREALNILEEEKQVVVVPQDFNAIRTNNRDLVDDFTNFDYRISEDTTKDEINIHYLFISRQRHALIRTKYLMSQYGPDILQAGKQVNFRNYDIIFEKIEQGYQKAAEKEYQLIIRDFCIPYQLNPHSVASYLAFNQNLVLNGIQKDLVFIKT